MHRQRPIQGTPSCRVWLVDAGRVSKPLAPVLAGRKVARPIRLLPCAVDLLVGADQEGHGCDIVGVVEEALDIGVEGVYHTRRGCVVQNFSRRAHLIPGRIVVVNEVEVVKPGADAEELLVPARRPLIAVHEVELEV